MRSLLEFLADADRHSIKTLCSSCTHQSCCTGFDSAIVFPEDFEVLKQLGIPTSDFLEDTIIAGRKIKQIRKKQSGECFFWNNGCGIYGSRPLDCRLFPFDIEMVNNEFYWIAYSCNKNSDWKWTDEHLRRFETDPMLYKKLDYIEIFYYAPYTEPEKMPYTILRKVRFGDQDAP